MYHAIGITPEAKSFKDAFQGDSMEDTLDITRGDLYNFKDELFEAKGTPDLIAVGCTHASLEELERISDKVKGRHLREGVEFWIFTSRYVRDLANKRGLIQNLIKSGIRVLSDTCMVVAPLEEMGFHFVVTNSGKASFYIPKLSKNRLLADIESIDDIINMTFE